MYVPKSYILNMPQNTAILTNSYEHSMNSRDFLARNLFRSFYIFFTFLSPVNHIFYTLFHYSKGVLRINPFQTNSFSYAGAYKKRTSIPFLFLFPFSFFESFVALYHRMGYNRKHELYSYWLGMEPMSKRKRSWGYPSALWDYRNRRGKTKQLSKNRGWIP